MDMKTTDGATLFEIIETEDYDDDPEGHRAYREGHVAVLGLFVPAPDGPPGAWELESWLSADTLRDAIIGFKSAMSL